MRGPDPGPAPRSGMPCGAASRGYAPRLPPRPATASRTPSHGGRRDRLVQQPFDHAAASSRSPSSVAESQRRQPSSARCSLVAPNMVRRARSGRAPGDEVGGIQIEHPGRVAKAVFEHDHPQLVRRGLSGPALSQSSRTIPPSRRADVVGPEVAVAGPDVRGHPESLLKSDKLGHQRGEVGGEGRVLRTQGLDELAPDLRADRLAVPGIHSSGRRAPRRCTRASSRPISRGSRSRRGSRMSTHS